jgi:hypothetical protein
MVRFIRRRGGNVAGIQGTIRDELITRHASHVLDALKLFADDFTITWVNKVGRGTGNIWYFFLKPEDHMRKTFGLEREVLLVYSEYPTTPLRVFQDADQFLDTPDPRGRVDQLVYLVLAQDPDIEGLVQGLRSDASQSRIVVPYHTAESTAHGPGLVVQRFKEYLFRRDLFDIEQPIKTDVFFFGRSAFIADLLDSIRSGTNVGLFGLRKSGKTSLLYKLERHIARDRSGRLIYFDLQNPALYDLRWWELLEHISQAIGVQSGEASYTEANAAKRFGDNVGRHAGKRQSKRLILALDEVEHIAPDLSLRDHWKRDFLELWKTLRAVQNQYAANLSLLVSGVNASVVEQSDYEGYDNPLFSMAKIRYMPPFSVQDVAAMVSTLGHYMGLEFEDRVFDHLREHYGGHPLLTRLACSRIYQKIRPSGELGPAVVDLEFVRAHTPAIDRELFAYARHILSVLVNWYPSEIEMLQCLAQGDTDFFGDMAREVPAYAEHLRAYGLVEVDPPSLRMPFLQTYLSKGAARTAESTSSTTPGEGRLAAISESRNRLEPKLRRLVTRTFKVKLGQNRWINPIIGILPADRRARTAGISGKDIVERHLYLEDLLRLMTKHWDTFNFLEKGPKDIQVQKPDLAVLMRCVNAYRPDAHAGEISDVEFATVQAASLALEKAVDAVLED